MKSHTIAYFGTYFTFAFFGLLLITDFKLLNVSANQIIYIMLISISSLIYPLTIFSVYPYLEKRYMYKSTLKIVKIAYVVLVAVLFMGFNTLMKQIFAEDIVNSMYLLILLPPIVLVIGILSE
jgi:hypothetical protein